MFRWVTLSIALHAVALLIFSDFLPLTATSSTSGQLSAIEAILLHKPTAITSLATVGEVKETLSASRIAVPVPNAAKPTMEKSFPAAHESVATPPPAIAQIAGGGPEVGEMHAKPAERVSQDGLREYRLNLSREARRYKRYPMLARQHGVEGVVVVVVSTSAGLPVPQVSLSRSSGQELLDLQALEMLGLAVRAASLPDSLRGRDFAIDLPIHFSLNE